MINPSILKVFHILQRFKDFFGFSYPLLFFSKSSLVYFSFKLAFWIKDAICTSLTSTECEGMIVLTLWSLYIVLQSEISMLTSSPRLVTYPTHLTQKSRRNGKINTAWANQQHPAGMALCFWNAASGLWSRTGGRNKIAAHTAGNKEWLYRAEINCIIERRSWPLMAAGIKEDFVSSILRTEAWRNERWVRIFNPTVTSLLT